MTYRAKAFAVIQRVIDENAGKPAAEVRRAVRQAYPWGDRKNWPYKAWLQAQRELLARNGLARPKPVEDGRQIRIPGTL